MKPDRQPCLGLPHRRWLLTLRDGSTIQDASCCADHARLFYETCVSPDRMNEVVKVEESHEHPYAE